MENAAEVREGSNEGEVELPSCDGCRRRKLRCSREWPTCSHCRRLSSACTYEYQRKKPGIKGGAVEALSRRVDALENAVFDSPGSVRLVSSTAVRPESQISEINTSGDAHALGGILSVLTQEIHQLNSNLSTSSVRTTYAATSSPSLNHDTTRNNGSSNRPEHPRKRIRLSSFLRHHELPDEAESISSSLLARADVVEELVDAYFGNIHPWIPILHETRFRDKLADSRHHDQCFIILHAILVAALRLIEEQNRVISISEIQVEVKRSRAIVMSTAMSDISLENLQALVIIAFTDIGHGETRKAWSTVGSLARTIHYLQLSVEPSDLVEPAALLSDLPSLPQPEDWIEEEERRRLFWNVFLLDRFCSITTGWNVSLTAEDVCRRLPIDGGLWARNQPAMTPYLGIWDHSAAKIGHSITYLPSKYNHPSSTAGRGAGNGTGATDSPDSHQINTASSAEVLKIGAFAYYVESVESLSRINSYFVQQDIDFTNRQDVFSWLTRFKELDLRLVHWRMSLPQRWKNPNDNPNPAPITAMDPNMTLAHVTHNMSSILLHHKIAYPGKELGHLKLPNACSADTCFVAATETSNITTKYLEHAPVRRVLAPHFAICIFVSARVLLVHSLHYNVELAPEFWTLVECLEAIDSKWKGRLLSAPHEPTPLAGSLATELRQLHDLCQRDQGNHHMAKFRQVLPKRRNGTKGAEDGRIAISQARENHSHNGDTPLTYGETPNFSTQSSVSGSALAGGGGSTLQGAESVQHDQPISSLHPDQNQNRQQLQPADQTPQIPMHDQAAVDELSAISQGLMDQSFLAMNRIINFDDFMFITDPSVSPYMTGL